MKIEPQSIGVGQYQHDVDQRRLSKALDAVVEDAVNAVGVDLNTASAALLAMSRASARGSPKPSSRTATPPARSARARAC